MLRYRARLLAALVLSALTAPVHAGHSVTKKAADFTAGGLFCGLSRSLSRGVWAARP